MQRGSSSSSSRIYYFDREGPTNAAVLLQGTLSQAALGIDNTKFEQSNNQGEIGR